MAAYSTDGDGKFIPSSQRPDGTWRKARRVKEGYVPQEEVPLYESKGKQFASKSSDLPVGMCPLAAQAAKEKREKQKLKQQRKTNSVSGLIVLPPTVSIRENSQPKPKLKQNHKEILNKLKVPESESSTNTFCPVDSLTDQVNNIDLENGEQDILKKLKKFKKKLREIENIESKVKSGELKKPDKDQLDKVKRKKEIMKEIKDLETLVEV